MPTFPFGEWLPDRPALGNPGMLRAENVVPGPGGPRPFRDLQGISNALDARPRGAIAVRSESGTDFKYAGDTAKLYQNVGDVWTDVSVGGGYATGADERWEFVLWENKLLAVNFSNNPQQISLGGANFSNLTTDFRARHIARVRDFVVVANTFDATDDNKPSRVRWSAFGDETNWTVSPSTLADFRDLRGEAIERVFGGEYGVIFQRNSIHRMSFAGAPVVFDIDEVVPGIGLLAPGAAVQVGDAIFFLSDQGFFRLDLGSRATPIGAQRVDRFVLDTIDKQNLDRVSSVADSNNQRILWAYPDINATDGRPNNIVVFDRALDQWSFVNLDVELLWRTVGSSTSVDDATLGDVAIDTIDTIVDSAQWIGGSPGVGAFTTDFKSGQFDGDQLTGLIETGETAFTEGRKTRLKGFRPLVEGGAVMARVGVRDNQDADVTFKSADAPRSGGRMKAPRRVHARFHRLELTLSGDWTSALGVEIAREDIKAGARRG